jgi:hypothetical protein
MGTPKQQDEIFTEEHPFMDKPLIKISFCCLHVPTLKIEKFGVFA